MFFPSLMIFSSLAPSRHPLLQILYEIVLSAKSDSGGGACPGAGGEASSLLINRETFSSGMVLALSKRVHSRDPSASHGWRAFSRGKES
jgi:hypothetical protein